MRLDAYQREDWPGLLITYPERTERTDKEHRVTWIPPTHTVWEGRELELDFDTVDGSREPNYRLEVTRYLRKVDIRGPFGFSAPIVRKIDRGDEGSYLRPAAGIQRISRGEVGNGETQPDITLEDWTLEPLPEYAPAEIQRDAFFRFGPIAADASGRPEMLSDREFKRTFVLRYEYVKSAEEVAPLLEPVTTGYGKIHCRVERSEVEGSEEVEQSFDVTAKGQAFQLPGGYQMRVNLIENDYRMSEQRGMWSAPEPRLEVLVWSDSNSKVDRRMLYPYSDPGSLGQQDQFNYPEVFVRFDWDAWRYPVAQRFLLVQREGEANPKLYSVPEVGGEGQLVDEEVLPGEELALNYPDPGTFLRLDRMYKAVVKNTRLIPNFLIFAERPHDDLERLEREMLRGERRREQIPLTWIDVSFLEDDLIKEEGFDVHALTLSDLHERWKVSDEATTEKDFAAFLRARAHTVSVSATDYFDWRHGAKGPDDVAARGLPGERGHPQSSHGLPASGRQHLASEPDARLHVDADAAQPLLRWRRGDREALPGVGSRCARREAERAGDRADLARAHVLRRPADGHLADGGYTQGPGPGHTPGSQSFLARALPDGPLGSLHRSRLETARQLPAADREDALALAESHLHPRQGQPSKVLKRGRFV